MIKYNEFTNNKHQIEVLLNQPLALYTYTKTGGPAEILAFPENTDQVKYLVELAEMMNLPITTIGNASNLIVKDGGIKGLTMILTKMKNISVENKQIVAQAGARLMRVTEVAQESSLTGLEFAAGIPGSVGGGLFMNAGAYGGDIDDVVIGATVMTQQGKIIHLDAAELDFGYRHTSIQDNHQIVLDATFSLQVGIAQQIQMKMDKLNALRAAKQPLELPSCGSVFKRPVGYFAGKLIHDAGLQGFQIGGAQVSKKHAGFIVNVDHASATDYLNVIKHVQDTVFNKFGVHLETEVRIIGKDTD